MYCLHVDSIDMFLLHVDKVAYFRCVLSVCRCNRHIIAREVQKVLYLDKESLYQLFGS